MAATVPASRVFGDSTWGSMKPKYLCKHLTTTYPLRVNHDHGLANKKPYDDQTPFGFGPRGPSASRLPNRCNLSQNAAPRPAGGIPERHQPERPRKPSGKQLPQSTISKRFLGSPRESQGQKHLSHPSHTDSRLTLSFIPFLPVIVAFEANQVRPKSSGFSIALSAL